MPPFVGSTFWKSGHASVHARRNGPCPDEGTDIARSPSRTRHRTWGRRGTLAGSSSAHGTAPAPRRDFRRLGGFVPHPAGTTSSTPSGSSFSFFAEEAHLLSIPASYRIVGHSCRRSHIANATFQRLGNQVYRPSPQIRPGRSCFRGSFPSGGIFTQQSGNMVGYFAASVRPVSSLFRAAIKRGGQKTCRGSFIRSDMSRSCIRCVYDIARVLR